MELDSGHITALISLLVLGGGGLVGYGVLQNRVRVLEREMAAIHGQDVDARLARLEEGQRFILGALERIERRLDVRSEKV